MVAAVFARNVVAIAAGCRGIVADVCEAREQGDECVLFFAPNLHYYSDPEIVL